jgi:peroxiredoxin
VISAMISHAVMIREQGGKRGWRYSILCALAVLTRMFGENSRCRKCDMADTKFVVSIHWHV